MSVAQPLLGLDMTVTTHVRYTLKDTQSGSVVLDKMLVASYTATVGDAFVGAKRLRLANEGAAKENLRSLVLSLSKAATSQVRETGQDRDDRDAPKQKRPRSRHSTLGTHQLGSMPPHGKRVKHAPHLALDMIS